MICMSIILSLFFVKSQEGIFFTVLLGYSLPKIGANLKAHLNELFNIFLM